MMDTFQWVVEQKDHYSNEWDRYEAMASETRPSKRHNLTVNRCRMFAAYNHGAYMAFSALKARLLKDMSARLLSEMRSQ
jgi:hypothetical protein